MTPELSPEFRDRNAGRAYPFDENSTRTADNAVRLPDNWLIDLHAHIPELVGRLYLSRVSIDENLVEFSDTSGRELMVSCTLPTAPGALDLYDTTPYRRKLGVAVFGEGASDLSLVGGEAVFTRTATPLVAAAALPLPIEGVQGLDVGGQLMTGDVQFIGLNSLNVHSYVTADGQSRVRVDVMGEHLPNRDCVSDDCTTPIQCVRFQVEAGSPVTVSKAADNRAVLTTVGYDMSDLCPTPPEKQPLPTEQPDLLCDPEEEEDPVPYEGAEATVITICADSGQLFIDTPDALGYQNPLDARVETVPATAAYPVIGGATNLKEFERKLRASRESLTGIRGRLKLEMRA